MKRMLMRPALRLPVLVFLAAATGCGSRTELFLGDVTGTGATPDASVTDASAPNDAGDDADAASVACTPGTFPLSTAIPAIMFVLDRSGSMDDKFGQDGTRWQTLTNALSSTLPPVNATMEIGALLFPTAGATDGNGMTCAVGTGADLAPAIDHVPALLTLLTETTPGGGTPTFGALGVAAGVLRGIRAATTARAIVLATDGAPNCNDSLDPQTCTCAGTGQQACLNDALECLDNVRTVQSIASYAAEGLPTYVIGIQDATDIEFTQVLNAMAVAGGRPQTGASTSYYAATSGADLATALVTIRNQVGGCTFLTTSVPGDEGTITVTLDGAVIPYDPTGKTGWSWGDESNGQIVLAGSTCAAAVASTTSTLVAQVGCSVPDASVDGSVDASVGAGSDAALDGSRDANDAIDAR
jgi:hypothetical protein